jgi:hypothetical protein
MATIAAAAITGAAAIGSGVMASKSASDQQDMIKEQMKEARRIRKENEKIANTSYEDIIGLIEGTNSIDSYLDKGQEISDSQIEYRMKYILGDTESDLREAQRINTSLASYDFTDINKNVSDLLKSNLYDIASLTRDSPSGSFANLSVQNMAGLAQQGLANAINTGEYISKISGIDQFTPYRIAQDLFTVERDKSGQKIQAVSNKASMITGNNNQWFSNFSDLSNASMVVEANRSAAMISAVNSAAGAASGYLSGMKTRQLQDKQMNYYDALISKYTPAQATAK